MHPPRRPGAVLLTTIAAAALAAVSLAVSAQDRAQADPSRGGVARAVKLSKASEGRDCPAPPPFEKSPEGSVSYRDCADTPALIRLNGSRFTMGETGSYGTLYERPLREVTVPGFSIGKYEVTFDEWDACVRARGCLREADDEGWGRGNRPVINVSWVDAQQYAAWLSAKTGRRYRLPSEAEWEYAARAGSAGRYYWGDGAEWACAAANVFDLTGSGLFPHWHWRATCDDGHATTAPVGSFKPNGWGLHDTSGNVWEWVQDCWHSDYTGAPVDGSAWVQGGQCGKRVNRGGGWGNHPRSMRSATRDADSAEAYSNAMGFRIVRDR
jgi:formylglycine-generating enzyme required for sulfatase activity